MVYARNKLKWERQNFAENVVDLHGLISAFLNSTLRTCRLCLQPSITRSNWQEMCKLKLNKPGLQPGQTWKNMRLDQTFPRPDQTLSMTWALSASDRKILTARKETNRDDDPKIRKSMQLVADDTDLFWRQVRLIKFCLNRVEDNLTRCSPI